MNRVVTVAEDKVVVMRRKSIEGLVGDSSSSWVPDSVTGYYQSANCVKEVDPAVMKEMLLSNRQRGERGGSRLRVEGRERWMVEARGWSAGLRRF